MEPQLETIYEITTCDRNEMDENIRLEQGSAGEFKEAPKSDFVMGTHLPDFQCKLCGFKAYRSTNLNAHFRQVHEQVPADFKCTWCTYATSRKTDLANHRKSYHGEKISGWKNMNPAFKLIKDAPMQADLSLKIEDRTPSFMGPQSESSEVWLEPRLTPKTLQAAISILEGCQLKKHLTMPKVEKSEFEGLPLMSFLDKSTPQNHVEEATTKELFLSKCPICPFQTKEKNSLKKHLLAIHEIVEISNNDNEDGMPVDEDSGIWEAEIEENGGKIPAQIYTKGTLHCIKCNFSTNNGKYVLKEHERTEHKGVVFKYNNYKNVILNCSRCNFSTRNGWQHLKDHEMRVHEGVFFKCDICGKAASRKGGVLEHKRRVHEGIKQFKCTICEYANFEKKQVINHVRKCHPDMDDNSKVEGAIVRIARYDHKGNLIKM